MKITDLLKKEAVQLGAKANNKKDIINQAVDLMEKQGVITDKEKYIKAV